MKSCQKPLVFFLCLIALAFAQPAAAEEVPLLIIDDQIYTFGPEEVTPQIIHDRFYVPLRVIVKGLHYDVTWHETTNQIHITHPEKPLHSQNAAGTYTDIPQIYTQGKVLPLDDSTGIPYVIDPGVTIVPLRVIAEALELDVVWENHVVILKRKPAPPMPVLLPVAASKVTRPLVAETNVGTTTITANGQNDDKYPYIPAYDLTIFGASTIPQDQFARFLANKEGELLASSFKTNQPFTAMPENIVALYYEIGEKYNIRGDLALAQALKETRYFQYGGEVKPTQNNYCGLGAIGRVYTEEDVRRQQFSVIDPEKVQLIAGTQGVTFATPRFGVEAHIQHLYSYATRDPLPSAFELVDPRFTHQNRGIANKWIDLNGKWAVPGKTYGESIITDYWQKAFDFTN